MTEQSEPLYILADDRALRVLGPAGIDGRVPCGGGFKLTVWPRQDREFPGYTATDHRLGARRFGAEWTLVTLPELAHLRLLGRITRVVETGE